MQLVHSKRAPILMLKTVQLHQFRKGENKKLATVIGNVVWLPFPKLTRLPGV